MAFPYKNSGAWNLADDPDAVKQYYTLATYWVQQ
jgi:hypothetical protein